MRHTLVLLVVAASGVLAGCAPSPPDAARTAIEVDLEQQLGIDFADVECQNPGTRRVGTQFQCQATGNGSPLTFDVLIDRKDHVSVTSDQLVLPSDLALIEPFAVELIQERSGVALADDALDCGDRAIVLDQGQTIACGLDIPGSGIHDASIVIHEPETLRLSVDVDPEPRP